jgi:subtilisin family serine protease
MTLFSRMISCSRILFVLPLLVISSQVVFAEPVEETDIVIDEFLPVPVFDEDHPASNSKRLILITNTDITDAILNELEELGKVHNWNPTARFVSMTPRKENRYAIPDLPFVAFAGPDTPRYLTDIGSWDRDLLDVVDVEEIGMIGAPDSREIEETGAGVHVAIIDDGLPNNWRDFLPEERVNTGLATAVMGGGIVIDRLLRNDSNTSRPSNLFEHDNFGHGMAVASQIIGFKFGASIVDGVAPGARVIPIKVFSGNVTWSSRIIGAIHYLIDLKSRGLIGPTVINMSLGGDPNPLERLAIQEAIASDIIVVVSAGNRGEFSMTYPGAFPEVISAGAVGWTRQFRPLSNEVPNFGFWILQDVGFDPDPAAGAPAEESEAYVANFSSRAIAGLPLAFQQELDVLAPGDYILAPFGFGPKARYIFFGGTSASSPLTAGVAALMLEKNPALTQAEVEAIMKSTARPMNAVDSRPGVLFPGFGEITVSWDDDCFGWSCDPVGAGLLQADAAVDAVP